MKTALICGITGQDGAYLAKLLIEKNYRVIGTTRALSAADLHRATRVGAHRIELRELRPNDGAAAMALVHELAPDELYALWGQSSVGRSFAEPSETFESIAVATQTLLEAVRMCQTPTRVLHASSGECFGSLNGVAATEETPFRPCSPYGASKAAAHHLVSIYRDSYGLFSTNAILFNHESPLRPATFVTRKIALAAYRIANGSGERLSLGRTDIIRDWGWAPEYVEGMWRILQEDEPRDYILATGHSYPLSAFVEASFAYFELDWLEFVDIDPSLGRPSDPWWSGADPSRAERRLGWRAETLMPDVARAMVAAEVNNLP
jgi:GDPmannose 4,6-dehydratase